MRRLVLILIALVTTGAAPLPPEETVGKFYAAYWALRIPGGVPDGKARGVLAPYLSQSLTEKLADAEKAEQRYAARTKNEAPPLVEGDLFTSLFEGASALDAVRCANAAKTARCNAALRYEDPYSKETVRWTDEILLTLTEEGWRIDDIAYGGSWEFMHKGHLRDLLDQAVKDADAPL